MFDMLSANIMLIGVAIAAVAVIVLGLILAKNFYFPRTEKDSGEDAAERLEAQDKGLQSQLAHLRAQGDSARADAQAESERLSQLRREYESVKRDGDVLQREYSAAQDRLSQLRGELDRTVEQRRVVERSIEDKRLQSVVPVEAQMALSPGQSAYVLIRVPAVSQNSMCYEPVRKAAAGFSIPEELEPVPQDVGSIVWGFDDKRVGSVAVVDEKDAKELDGLLYFVGDIHGDYDSLSKILKYVFMTDEKSRIVFMGDLFDRGEKSLECVRLLVWAARRFPGQITWIKGNHDCGFRYDQVSGKFTSEVDPAEFSDWLNANPDNAPEGRFIADLIERLPVAIVLGDIWAAHGGVLQADASERFDGFGTLDDQMTNDIIWSRMRDVPSKVVNRRTRGAEVGYKNACAFRDAVKARAGIEIRHIVCAHQHEYRNGVGYLAYESLFNGDLTCQCISSFSETGTNNVSGLLIYKAGATPVPKAL